MQIEANEIIEGIFREEVKNRFRCVVAVDGTDKLCYISSSSRLSNFIELENRTVLLQPNTSVACKTKYSVFAVKGERDYILLNLATANAVIADQLYRRYFSFLGNRKQLQREVMIEGYKADIYINDTDTIVEVKTILSENAEALFPTVYSERALKQLSIINELLSKGKKVCYLFVSMNPYTKKIRLNVESQFYVEFSRCVGKGLMYKGCAIKLKDDTIKVSSAVEIIR